MASASGDDSKEFIEQARWLLEWHNRRDEAFVTRAVAILGFNGVVLAILLQGAGLKGIDPTPWTWVFLTSALVALVASATSAVLTITPKPTAAPGVPQLRYWWQRHAASPRPGTSTQNIAESFLNSKDLTAVSAVSAAMESADHRAIRFRLAARSMIVAIGFLSLLLCNILKQTWGK